MLFFWYQRKKKPKKVWPILISNNQTGNDKILRIPLFLLTMFWETKIPRRGLN